MSRDVLATAGILSILIICAALIYGLLYYLSLRRRSQERTRKLLEQLSQQSSQPPPEEPVPIETLPVKTNIERKRSQERTRKLLEQLSQQSSQPPPEEPVSIETSPVKTNTDKFRAYYNALFEVYNVPRDAIAVESVSNLFLPGASLWHYCWTDAENIYFFPVWDSLFSLLKERLMPENEDTLQLWSIPLNDIVCHVHDAGLPHPFAALQFKKNNRILTAAFSPEAAEAFSAILPHHESVRIVTDRYPHSAHNIRDIKESISAIKDLWQAGLITEAEYDAQKKNILISM